MEKPNYRPQEVEVQDDARIILSVISLRAASGGIDERTFGCSSNSGCDFNCRCDDKCSEHCSCVDYCRCDDHCNHCSYDCGCDGVCHCEDHSCVLT